MIEEHVNTNLQQLEDALQAQNVKRGAELGIPGLEALLKGVYLP